MTTSETTTSEYAKQSQKHHWLSPDVLFGLTYAFVWPGQSLLDIGIGTGLSSIPFHKAGLHIYGIDFFGEVLKHCAAQAFAHELKQWDLTLAPLPYPDAFFDHAIANGVFHLLEDLEPTFNQVARIVKEQGTFAFTIEELRPGFEAEGYVSCQEGEIATKALHETDFSLYRHSEAYVIRLLQANGFALRKQLEFLAFVYPEERENVYFKAYVAQKVG
jgi:predicted TPR repeat methyltransferase